jgi:deoxyribose-phosphate aldolase
MDSKFNKKIASIIDHTVLKAEASKFKIIELCGQAKNYNFASVCINPAYVSLAAELLEGSNVKVCTVIGFPLGANTTEVKAFEAADAVKNGADEVDMVINIGALKSNEYEYVLKDISAVINAVKGKALVKVIIETCYLSNDEKVIACKLAKEAGADFVKTSTGFGTGGATQEDIELMRKTVGLEMGVKASGGISDIKKAEALIEAGATRLGTSASIKIVEEK